MTEEIHKPIPGWPEYTCSNKGTITRVSSAYGTRPGKVLKWLVMRGNGYAKVSLCRNAKRKEYLVHRLVAMTFIQENIPPKMDVCHYDGNKLNNSLENLRVDTRWGNSQDQIRLGRTPRGEKCGSNVHTEEKVRSIKAAVESGRSQSEVAREFGVRSQYVHNIMKGYIWGWL